MTDTAAKRFSALNVSSPWRGLSYFPTGTVDEAERLAVAYLYSGIAAEAPVEVPDVVGETEAAGTTTLEGDGFVVAVETAHSPTVSEGLIISQDPVGGSFAASGSTVTITVSLGPEPVSDEQPSGGWKFLSSYESELQRRRTRKKERDELEAETEQIQDELDRNIALLMREQEAKDDKRKDFERLADLARQSADLEAARQYSERVATAYARAIDKGTFSAVEALDRELSRAREEEEFLLTALLLLAD